MPIANASQHLQALRRARLVDARREGTSIYYRLADEGVFRLWQAIRDLSETRLAEIDQLTQIYLKDRDQLEALDALSLLHRLQQGEAVVIDVRPVEEYRAGHIPGARSIPVDQLESRLEELPTGMDVIAYCRGPYCVFSDEAVALLQSHGFSARRLDVGLPDWRLAGFPVATD
jgi:rhodanese-related sulfurtransferase